jgi:hypothetical protein
MVTNIHAQAALVAKSVYFIPNFQRAHTFRTKNNKKKEEEDRKRSNRQECEDQYSSFDLKRLH